MAGFPERRRALTNAAFAAFGEDATREADGTIVRVRLREQDDEGGFGGSQIRQRTLIVRLRSWEVVDPARGEIFAVESGRIGLIASPDMDSRGVWFCPAARIP